MFEIQPLPCSLAQGTVDNIVAHGRIVSSNPTHECHHVRLGNNNVKVAVDVAVDPQATVPFPSHEISTVNEAVDSFTVWPKALVVVPPKKVF